MYFTTKRVFCKLRQTTIGWEFIIEWKDGSISWISLKVFKQSNPIEVADYLTTIRLENAPAFSWWVLYTLKKRDCIIFLVNIRFQKRNHNFGIQNPQNIKGAISLQEKHGKTLWQFAYAKEMYQVGVSFKILQYVDYIPVGYKKSSGHMIFDVNMDFTRKACWFKKVHLTPDLEDSNYAGVVSHEVVKIALTYAALHQTLVLAADIRNTYLQAPTSEKHYIICGLEFGLDNIGKRALIVCYQYGKNAAGCGFCNHQQSCMGVLGFKSKGDFPDVWMRPATQKDGKLVYEYVLLYTDGFLVVS